VKVFADALEIIPKTLAQNAGFDQIEILMKVRAAHGKGLIFAALDLNTNEVVDDMVKENVIEPVNVKKQAIKSASECAQMILRIDDVIAGVGGGGGGAPGGMPPGMGGMGGMPPGMM